MKPDLIQHTIREARLRLDKSPVMAQSLTEVYPLGVDLSAWQGTVNFAKLATKVQFAYLRAGYGNDYIDPRFNEYRQGCIDHGIKWGMYWYIKPGKDWRKHAANFFLKYLENHGDLPPCIDFEESGGLAKSALHSWVQKLYIQFCNLTGLEYEDLMTYTRASFLDTAMDKTDWLKRTQLWVAHWTTAREPILPKEWVDITNPKTWICWQYSAKGSGIDYGVSSRYVDLDRAKFGIPVPPPPAGDEMKYRVLIDALKIRSEPAYPEGEVVGLRTKGDIVSPVDTIGDADNPRSYWVKDAKGWSAAQWLGVEYMEPFV